MASQGPRSGSTFTQDATGQLWSTLGNLGGVDSQYATVNLTSFQGSNQVKASGYGFSVPAAATITGVAAAFTGHCSFVPDSLFFIFIQLMINLTPGGTDKGSGVDPGNTLNVATDTVLPFGGPGDLWGNALTPAIVNASGFGVFFRLDSETIDAEQGSVDDVAVTVYYSEGVAAVPVPLLGSGRGWGG